MFRVFLSSLQRLQLEEGLKRNRGKIGNMEKVKVENCEGGRKERNGCEHNGMGLCAYTCGSHVFRDLT